MAYYRWNGSVGSYLDPSRWSPAGVPLYGADNTAEIASGIATLSNAEPNGLNFFIGSAAGAELLLDNAALGAATHLNFFQTATLGIKGYDSSYASFTVSSALTIDTTGYGQLNQYGTITVTADGTLRVGADGVLNNGGLIQFAGGSGIIDDSIVGNGTISIGVATSSLTVNGASGADETFALRAGSLTVSNLQTFRSKVSSFDSVVASLTVRGLAFDAAAYAVGPGGATLNLLNGTAVVGQVALAGPAATAFAVTRNGDGSSTIRPATNPPSQVFTDGSIPAVIQAGTVVIRNAAPNGQGVEIGSGNVATQPVLVLDNAALGPDLRLNFITQGGMADTAYATIAVLGYDTSEASFALGGRFANPDVVTIALGPYAQLNQYGTIAANIASSLTVQSTDPSAPGRLNNGGLIQLSGSTVRILADLMGNGEVRLTQFGAGSGGGSLELGGSVGADQRIRLDGGRLTLDDPSTFHATISDFVSFGPSLVLRNTVADAAALRTTDSGTVLDVTRSGAVVDTIRVAGTLSRDGYDVTYDAASNSSTIVGHTPF